MPIPVLCPTCGAALPVPDEFAGRVVRCGGCHGVIHVPAPDGQPASLPPPPPPRPARPVVATPLGPPPRRQPVPRTAAPVGEDDPLADRPRRPRKPRSRPRSILTPAGRMWLALLGAASVVGVCTLLFAAADGHRPIRAAGRPAAPPPPAAPPRGLPPWAE